MRAAAAELEQLGFGTIWIPGGFDGPLLEICEDQLAATREICVATGILNVFGHDPGDVARDHARLDGRFPGASCSASASVTRNSSRRRLPSARGDRSP